MPQAEPSDGIAPAKQEVTRRLVFNFPGFEQTDSNAQIGRLQFCGEKTGQIWGFNVDAGKRVTDNKTHHTLTDFSASDKNWETHIDLVQFHWNDIVHGYERDSFPGGFLKNLRKYLGFFLDGTVARYLKASWRYTIFTVYPLLLAALFFILTFGFLGLFIQVIWVNLAASIALTLGFCKWPGDRLYISLTIADWAFARDMINRKNLEIEERFSEFGTTIANKIHKSSHDEIVIVGHSFGSLWAVGALAMALEEYPDLLKNKKVTFLALGSSMLKIALAPDARHIRNQWHKVMGEADLFWHEVQTKDDLIAFYKCDPFQQLGFQEIKARYRINRIRFSKGMEKSRYKAMRKSFYRTHRQYILYYDKRVPFDHMLRIFAPFSAETLANDPKQVNRIDQSGTLG